MGQHGIVMPVAGAHKLPCPLAHKGTGNHPPHIEPGGIQLGPHQLAKGVEALKTKVLLMAGDLEYRIGRGVDNGRTGANMLLAQPIQHLCARGVAIAQHAGQRPLAHQSRQQFGRKTLYRLGKVVPVKQHGTARQHPVPGRGVLARGDLGGAAIGRHRLAIGLQPGGKLTPCGHHGVAQTEADQMGDLKRPLTPALRPARRALGGDMPQGVGSLVAKAGGIGSTANPQGVEHQNDSAGHQ